ncbi:MAG: magnesium-translocating P-type ATPase [Pseudomonadota bacterium]
MSSSQAGLDSTEAARRLVQYGPNDPAPKKRRSQLVELLLQFANPLVSILLFASVVSAFVGELVNAAIIVVIVSLSVTVNFVQTFRSQKAADRLRATVAPTATVLRNGVFADVPRASVVPGDVIRLSAGDLVPADARLLEAKDLHVQESALTGESMPVEKEYKAGDLSQATMVLLGTSVVSGTCTALVLATGSKTRFGEIATRLSARAPETEFDRGIKQFGALIMKAVFGLVMFILIVRIGTQRSAFESLLFAVALAVGLTPEFLPMITSVTLARGAVAMAKRKVIVKHLSAIQNLGSIDVLCSDKTGTLTRGTMEFDSSCDALGCASDTPLFFGRLNSKFETGIRSPLDTALLARVEPVGSSDYTKVDEVPFDFERRRLSVVVDKLGERILITKGAPEGILPAATSYATSNGQQDSFSNEARAKCIDSYEALCARGFRVLAVATRQLGVRPAYSKSDERELCLIGFLAFADPPLEGAKAALLALKRDGVHVKILTGDNELVTRHVCAEVGLDVQKVVLGSDLEAMNDWALAHVAERTTVFARMSPAQKHRIILALKRRSHVVGYLGDGINDAPSLHAADVGISVAFAVDVARDAADIILLETSLQVLHDGILEGRRAFGNVTKYLLMGTSSNFGNMFSMAAASVFLPFLPMLPTQILLNNLLYDLAQVTIPTDNVDPEVIREPQRWDIRTIRNFMLLIGPISSLYDLLTFFVLLRVFHASVPLFHTGWFVESLATQTLVLFVIRTPKNPLQSRPSVPLALTTIAIVLVGALLPYSPLAGLFGFVPVPSGFFVFLGAATLTYLGLVQVAKRYLLGSAHKRGSRAPGVDPKDALG